MAPRLKALRKEEDLAAIPVDQPVLVELEPGASAFVAEEQADREDDPPLQHADRRADDAGGDDPAVKTLKEQLAAQKTAQDAENERLRREAREANERAAAAERQAKEARTEVVDAESAAIDAGLTKAQQELESATLEVERAFEAGDAKGLAKAQARVGRASADIRDYERSAATLADNKKQAERVAQDEPKRNAPVDVVSAIDGNPNLMPAEKTWLKEHQDAVIDPVRNNELGVAYTHATRQGLIRGTEPYFRFIEQFMGYTKAPAAVDVDNDEERTTIVAAPVSRENRSPSGQPSNTRITLSPEQREMARSLGLSDVDYAKGVLAMNVDKKANPERYFRS